MSLMDSIDIQYVWKAIQESERSDEISYPNTILSEGLFPVCHSAQPERNDGEESQRKPAAPVLSASS